MKKQDRSRGPSGKRRGNATPNGKPTPAQPEAARVLTDQDLEQVQGGRAPVRVTSDRTDD